MTKYKWFQIANKAIESVLPEKLIEHNVHLKRNILRIKDYSIDLSEYKRIKILGSGKASVKMAKAMADKLKYIDFTGVIVCNYYEKINNIEVIPGEHPIPGENSLKAAEKIIKELQKLDEKDFFIYLLSGGSSAMVEMPETGLSLEDIKESTGIFINSGLDIMEVNTLRSRLSAVKGGKLNNFTKADGIVLILSDVIGDKLEFIGSGPFYNSENLKDVEKIINKYELQNKLPENVLNKLKDKNSIENNTACKIKHIIIGNLYEALINAKNKATNFGFNTYILTNCLEGEAKEAGKVFSSLVKAVFYGTSNFKLPLCLLAGGETVVKVKGRGIGGRNSEFTLSMLCNLNIKGEFCIGSFGTDGIDGVTNSAGAYFDEKIFDIIEKKGLIPFEYLEENDSGSFFEKLNYNFATGKTGTNVGDIIMILIEGVE